MRVSNWMYGECYEDTFADLEQEIDRWEKAKVSTQSVQIVNVTDKAQLVHLKDCLAHYNVGFGFNTFQVKSDVYFDLAYACQGASGDGGTLTQDYEANLDADDYGYEVIYLLSRICDDFLSQGSAWGEIDQEGFSINRALYKTSFTAINPTVFKQAVFQGFLSFYWLGQSGRPIGGINVFLNELQKLLPDYQPDTYFLRFDRIGEERFDFFACYGHTSPWLHYFSSQATFFAIDRKLKKIHTWVFAQNND